jgi:hypothetical protein
MRRIALTVTTAAFVLTAPAVASADVLVQAIPRHPVCGDALVPGIWAQPGTKGNRIVRIKAIDRRSGRVWWHRKARASTRGWRTWFLPSGKGGQCGPTTIVYRGRRPDGSSWTARYRVRFRSEGA